MARMSQRIIRLKGTEWWDQVTFSLFTMDYQQWITALFLKNIGSFGQLRIFIILWDSVQRSVVKNSFTRWTSKCLRKVWNVKDGKWLSLINLHCCKGSKNYQNSASIRSFSSPFYMFVWKCNRLENKEGNATNENRIRKIPSWEKRLEKIQYGKNENAPTL